MLWIPLLLASLLGSAWALQEAWASRGRSLVLLPVAIFAAVICLSQALRDAGLAHRALPPFPLTLGAPE